MAFCLIACTAFAMYLVVCGLSRIKEAARSQGVLDVDGYKEWLNVKNTHMYRATAVGRRYCTSVGGQSPRARSAANARHGGVTYCADSVV